MPLITGVSGVLLVSLKSGVLVCPTEDDSELNVSYNANLVKDQKMVLTSSIQSMPYIFASREYKCVHVDSELAMAEADKVEDDEDLRKKLWLMIAKHVVEQEKGTICSSLEDYNKQIEQLKEEMNDATVVLSTSEMISSLSQRCTIIDRDEECESPFELFNDFGFLDIRGLTVAFGNPLATKNESIVSTNVVEPCLHAVKLLSPPQTRSLFIACMTFQIESIRNMLQAEYILDLQKQLTLMSSEEKRESNGTLSSEDSIPSMTTVKNWFVQNLLSCARRHVSGRSLGYIILGILINFGSSSSTLESEKNPSSAVQTCTNLQDQKPKLSVSALTLKPSHPI
ncbi:hypothetical protein VNO77_28552 [Canavalia gladiata]|uniref:Uncharacterized protein n=1 Tax=Canavalia gladiata TaxID=3824 RepID=A0AAN9L0G0_CANGL